ncbi:2-hydroxyacid dehydrogenase [Allomeiothermus silvanus]|uniref:2-hydroxyacid dehydrogenase n=1 Tax=Allomeiothermus silvanus TaxID=52022 RepID=UPI0023F4A1A5|nr:2-hydroxyacid dehydrogenase [Allomeiothermus silvanus]
MRPDPLVLLVPERAAKYLGTLPDSVEVVYVGQEGAPSARALEAEFLVAGYGRGRMTELIPQLPRLRVVQTISAGVDWILPLIPPGVTLCNGSGIHDTPVAEWVVAALLALTKRFPDFRDLQREGLWKAQTVGDLEGSTVLILGYGSIGQAVEKRLEGFGVHLLRIARTPREGVYDLSALPHLLPQADSVVLLLPLTDETKGIVGRDFLNRMKPGALLINAGRGGLVDTPALIEALTARRLRAALDVTDPEPLPEDHPLWALPEVFITPHVAGASPKLFERAYLLVGEQVRRYLTGEPLLNVVEHGY